MKSSGELKKEVKETFRGRWKDAILLSIIPSIISFITFAIISALQFMMHWNQENNWILFLQIIVNVFISLLTTAVMFTLIDWMKDKDFHFNPLKANFSLVNSRDAFKIIMIMIVQSIFLFFWTLLLFVPGIIKGFSYSQALNLYKKAKDEGTVDNYSITDYITQSRELMDGNKLRYFLLELSFIGWDIVGIITLGFGFIWIIPYIRGTEAAFFNDLIEN